MDISGNYLLPCSQQRAWDALNDPELLKRCLKGCEALAKTAEAEFAGTVATRIGPVAARFTGKMVQSEIDIPRACRMNFEGQGGVAGFARGSANVTLEPEDGGTRLAYVADTQIGGKLAQMGARLVEGTARSMADDFFGKFAAAVAEPVDAAETTPGSAPETPTMVPPKAADAPTAPATTRSWLLYAALAVLVVMMIALLAR